MPKFNVVNNQWLLTAIAETASEGSSIHPAFYNIVSHLGSVRPAVCLTRPQYVLRSYRDSGSSRFPGREADISMMYVSFGRSILRFRADWIQGVHAGGQEDDAAVRPGEDGYTKRRCCHSDTSTCAWRNGSQLAWIGSATCAVQVSKVGPRCAPSTEIFFGVFCFNMALTRLVSMFRATFHPQFEFGRSRLDWPAGRACRVSPTWGKHGQQPVAWIGPVGGCQVTGLLADTTTSKQVWHYPDLEKGVLFLPTAGLVGHAI